MRTKTIGLIAHTEKAGVAKLARDVIREFKERSLKVIVENETAKIAKQKASGSIEQIAQRLGFDRRPGRGRNNSERGYDGR